MKKPFRLRCPFPCVLTDGVADTGFTRLNGLFLDESCSDLLDPAIGACTLYRPDEDGCEINGVGLSTTLALEDCSDPNTMGMLCIQSPEIE